MKISSTDSINWLHVEASSRCNAWCPACPRNLSGYGLDPIVIEQDLSDTRFADVLSQLPDNITIQFCGNYGDPIAAKNFMALLDLAIPKAKKIQIHTNGSLRSTKWWIELANKLANVDHDIWFGIDGLAGVHEIYRQGTDYNKIIENAQAFIGAGGYATWQFIPYAHNEHQIKDCIRESQRAGFKKFKLVKLYRNTVVARNYQTGEEFPLLPPKEFQHIIRMPRTRTQVDPSNCMHLSYPSVYLSANGKLSLCCYLARSKQFDTFEDLLPTVDLTDKVCLTNCGN
jgi:sulfatase maturation enzyme AslB (radical SAM superfamily)